MVVRGTAAAERPPDRHDPAPVAAPAPRAGRPAGAGRPRDPRAVDLGARPRGPGRLLRARDVGLADRGLALDADPPRRRPSSPRWWRTSARTCALGTTWCWRPSPSCTAPFPRWVSSGAAHHEVQVLVEVLADRAAVRLGDRRALASALLTLAGSRTPGGALAATGTGLVERVAVLRDTRPAPAAGGAGHALRPGAARPAERARGAALAGRAALTGTVDRTCLRRHGQAPVDDSTGASLVLGRDRVLLRSAHD